MNTQRLAPGSDAALAAGCTCPIFDNAHGRGYWSTGADKALFVIAYDCPLHGSASTGQQPEHAGQRTAFGYHAKPEPDDQTDTTQAQVDAAQARWIAPAAPQLETLPVEPPPAPARAVFPTAEPAA